MNPTVTICLPNLNHRRFLDERIESIFGQTFQDWELVVCDSYSDDGSWEFFQALARRDSRVRSFQAPRDGIYSNWNRCVDEARGAYIYMATSDDTFAPDCLEKLVAALERHQQCDLAHCQLRVIDEQGGDGESWWSEVSVFALSSGDLLNRPHLRRAPFDGLLHLLGKSVFISLTQMLIRRSLFERIGRFPVRWGPVGDFNWQMKAALVSDVVHVPDTWGGWRIHAEQATQEDGSGVPRYPARVEEMIADALQFCREAIDPEVAHALAVTWEERLRSVRSFDRVMKQLGSTGARRRFLLRELLHGSWPASLYYRLKLLGKGSVERAMPVQIRRMVEEVLGRSVLEPLDEACSPIGDGELSDRRRVSF